MLGWKHFVLKEGKFYRLLIWFNQIKKSLSNRKFYATYEWSPRDKTLRESKKREKHVHDRRSCWTLSCSVLVRLSWRSVRSSARARLCIFNSFLSQRVRVYRSLYCGVLFLLFYFNTSKYTLRPCWCNNSPQIDARAYQFSVYATGARRAAVILKKIGRKRSWKWV